MFIFMSVESEDWFSFVIGYNKEACQLELQQVTSLEWCSKPPLQTVLCVQIDLSCRWADNILFDCIITWYFQRKKCRPNRKRMSEYTIFRDLFILFVLTFHSHSYVAKSPCYKLETSEISHIFYYTCQLTCIFSPSYKVCGLEHPTSKTKNSFVRP